MLNLPFSIGFVKQHNNTFKNEGLLMCEFRTGRNANTLAGYEAYLNMYSEDKTKASYKDFQQRYQGRWFYYTDFTRHYLNFDEIYKGVLGTEHEKTILHALARDLFKDRFIASEDNDGGFHVFSR